MIKRLDSVFGAPLCHISPLLLQKRPAVAQTIPENAYPRIRTILVIRPGGIGDAVLVFPLLQHLRSLFSNAELHVLAEKRNAGVFESTDIADKIFLYDRFSTVDLLRVVSGKYDVVIDTEQYHNLSAIVAFMTGAKYRGGFDTGKRGDLFTHTARYSQKDYEVFSFLQLFTALSGKTTRFDKDLPFYPIDARHLPWVEETLAGLNTGRIAVIAPGASVPERRWAPKKFVQLIRWFFSIGFCVIIVGGKEEVKTAESIARSCSDSNMLNMAGKASLGKVAAIISRAKIYIGSDTGILHIAYGVGTPTVHLFGPGILEKWAPVGMRYRAITKELACSPCTQYGYMPPCPINVECMRRISVDEVKSAIKDLLALEEHDR